MEHLGDVMRDTYYINKIRLTIPLKKVPLVMPKVHEIDTRKIFSPKF